MRVKTSHTRRFVGDHRLWNRTLDIDLVGGSPGDLSEEQVTYEKRKKGLEKEL